ncbi:MAG: hypothetical protein FWD31_08510 [Planctomycetaceae bacterium]|nr:hypothetical protein [Planctomycetaceae bacterium]
MNEKPTFFNRTYHYARALSRWIKAGRPIRDEAEIERIFETCCKPCEAYDATSSTCGYCGCRVNCIKVAPLNKIAMATEECPLEKWGRHKE